MLIYGIHACVAALKNKNRIIKHIYATTNAVNNMKKYIDMSSFQVEKKDKNFLSEILPQGFVHQGVVVECEDAKDIFLNEVIKQGKAKSTIVILDQVTDPHNIGAILRSCAVFGGDGVVVQEKNSPNMNGLIAKIACGGAEEVPLIKEVNLARAIEKLKENEYWVVGLDERGKVSLSDTGLNGGKVAIVLGAEGKGIRPLILDKCDIIARIPMNAESIVTSCNVSVAASIALFEFYK